MLSPDQMAHAVAEFLVWVAELERSTSFQKLRVASKWYQGEYWEIYTRLTVTSSPNFGRNTLVIANIEVVEQLRGEGLLSLLVDSVFSPTFTSTAEFVAFENVHNRRLLNWLLERGFEASSPGEPFGATFYKRRFSSEGEKPADAGFC